MRKAYAMAIAMSALAVFLPMARAQIAKSRSGVVARSAEPALVISSGKAVAIQANSVPVRLEDGNSRDEVRALKSTSVYKGDKPMYAVEPTVKEVPFTGTFTNSAEVAEYGIIDSNKDGETWQWKEYNASMLIWSADKVTSDDWLVLPPLNLKSGMNYKFTVTCRNKNSSSTDYTELYEVKAGKEISAESVNLPIEVMGMTELKSNDYIDQSGFFSVPETGKYYVGIHYISPKWLSFMEVVQVSVKVDAGEPAALEDFSVTPGSNGEKTATVRFKTPTLTAAGDPLAELDSVLIKRNDSLVRTIDKPAAGTIIEWTDVLPCAGNYTYKAYCKNKIGKSMESIGAVYVGFDIPSHPENVKAEIAGSLKDSNVKLIWTPVEKDTAGNALPVSAVSYEVRNLKLQGYPVLATLEPGVTTATVNAMIEDLQQNFTNLAVFAVTERGRGLGMPSNKLVVGVPAALPFVESFPGQTMETGEIAIYNITTGNTQWLISNDDTFEGGVICSSDGDNGFVTINGSKDSESMIYTLMIDLAKAKNPEFSINLFNLTNNPKDESAKNVNEVSLMVREPNAENWTTVKTGKICELAPDALAWNRVEASLGEFKGKAVQVGVKVKTQNMGYTAIDALKVADALSYDLKLDGVKAPTSAETGEEFSVSATVSNKGKNAAAADKYSVQLYNTSTSEVIAEKNGVDMNPGAMHEFSFNLLYKPTEAGNHSYILKVVYPEDEKTDDNNAEFEILCKINDRPEPRNLSVQLDGNGTPQLTWSAPDMTSKIYTNQPIVEDFENPEYKAWTSRTEIGDWFLKDIDGLPVGGFENIVLPDIQTNVTTASFFLFDNSADVIKNSDFAGSFDAKSGNCYLASLYQAQNKQVDDWAISPKLPGTKQKISFFAKSYSRNYPEKFSVYHSTGSVNPSDFTLIAGSEVAAVPAEWTQYKFEVPQGSRRFAIRSHSTGAMMLMIDDISFLPLSNTSANLIGYNIYHNDIKVKTVPGTDSTFTDAEATKGDHSYYVTALYDNGEESRASNIVSATVGVNTVGSDDMTVNVVDGRIEINGATDTVTVTNLKGIAIYRGKSEIIRLNAAPGVYVVRTAYRTFKVIVE